VGAFERSRIFGAGYMATVWEHLSAPETLNLLFGHLLYGLLVGAIALFAASVSESAATAAIVTLAFTIGSWVLDFTAAGHPGLLEWVASLSLTQVLRTFEQGLLSAGAQFDRDFATNMVADHQRISPSIRRRTRQTQLVITPSVNLTSCRSILIPPSRCGRARPPTAKSPFVSEIMFGSHYLNSAA
jgi:hypothetical protein